MKTNKINIEKYKIPKGKVLIFRTCNKDMKSYNGFKWPELGEVICSDFKPTEQCGNGLHGMLKGEGDYSLLNWNEKAIWLLVEVDEKEIIQLNGKVKFPSGNVIYSGKKEIVISIMKKLYPECKVIGCTATAGNYGTATAGDEGTATAGDEGTATAGYKGTATAGYKGTATAGNYGTATAGNYGTATAGDEGILIITYYDNKYNCYKRKIALVGENGIKPNVKYKLNDNYEFVEYEKSNA